MDEESEVAATGSALLAGSRRLSQYQLLDPTDLSPTPVTRTRGLKEVLPVEGGVVVVADEGRRIQAHLSGG